MTSEQALEKWILFQQDMDIKEGHFTWRQALAKAQKQESAGELRKLQVTESG